MTRSAHSAMVASQIGCPVTADNITATPEPDAADVDADVGSGRLRAT